MVANMKLQIADVTVTLVKRSLFVSWSSRARVSCHWSTQHKVQATSGPRLDPWGDHKYFIAKFYLNYHFINKIVSVSLPHLLKLSGFSEYVWIRHILLSPSRTLLCVEIVQEGDYKPAAARTHSQGWLPSIPTILLLYYSLSGQSLLTFDTLNQQDRHFNKNSSMTGFRIYDWSSE